MKKYFALLLSILMIFTLAGCSNSAESNSTVQSPNVGDDSSSENISFEQPSSSEESNSTLSQTTSTSTDNTAPPSSETNSTQTDNSNKTGEGADMVIVYNGKEYTVEVEDSVTARDIIANLPLDLSMTKFGDHEFYSELDFTPELAEKRTSRVEAGHLYYWDGWNAFVLNYIDWDIPPYEVVHIGEVTDKSIVDELLQTGDNITISVNKSGQADTTENSSSEPATAPDETPSDVTSEPLEKENKVLVAFFSRADENYGVGVIEKGNTHIIAEMIAEETGGELFHIERDMPYPAEYDACTDEARKEKDDNARPTLKADIDISDYDIVYLGYPNWWGDMPMPVYTFLENHDWNGKTVIPFCTHAGSGLSRTESSVASTCSGADVLDGLAIAGTTAQNDRENAKEAVLNWLNGLDY